jgi:hypothetical protein
MDEGKGEKGNRERRLSSHFIQNSWAKIAAFKLSWNYTFRCTYYSSCAIIEYIIWF